MKKTTSSKTFFAIVIFTVLLFPFKNLRAQSFDWVTFIADGTIIPPNSGDVEIDAWGNTYCIGTFQASLTFPDTTIYAGSITGKNMFIVKYDTYGKRKWIKVFVGHENASGTTIKTDATGNIYILASGCKFNDTTDFTSRPFVAKLNSSNGELYWARQIPGAYAFDVDKNGNVYVGISSTISGYFGNLYLVNNGNWKIGVGKFDTNGNSMWAKYIEQYTPSQEAKYLDVSDNGNLIIGGVFGDKFAAIIDSNNGSILKELSSQGITFINAVLADNFGNYLVGGAFRGTVNFGSTTLVSVGQNDIFIASYKSTGSENWVRPIKPYGTNKDNVELGTIGNDKMGNYFICGHMSEKTVFEKDTILSWGPFDAFVAKYDKFGNYSWVKKIGSRSIDYAHTLAVNDDGVLSVMGSLDDAICSFDKDTVSAFSQDVMFISKIIDRSNLITGNVFLDRNNNGLKDTLETAFPQILITSQPSSHYVYSNQGGDYFLQMDKGSYSVYPATTPKYHIVHPNAYTVSFNGYGLKSTKNNFRIVPIPNITDLEIDLTNVTPARPGFNIVYQLTYKNVGTDTINGELSLKLDPLLSLVQVSDTPKVYSDSVVWKYMNFKPGEIRKQRVVCKLNSFISLGSMLMLNAVILPFINDTVPLNNKDTLIQRVQGSFDPNDKTVVPEGDVSTSFIRDTKPFEYTIHFQNTGTDTAFTVIVVDTLSQLLDLKSIEVISSSHKFSIEMKANGRIEFIFDDILLPDSTQNQLGSQGFIKYRIKPISTAIGGERIKNTAYIYFDYNRPVVTNTTSNLIISPIGIDEIQNLNSKLFIYPNPSNTSINYRLELIEPEAITWTIYNSQGKKVKTELNVNQKMSVNGLINLEGLSKGIYFLEMAGEKTKISKKVVIN